MVEHWNKLDQMITLTEARYGRRKKRSAKTDTFISGLREAKAWMEGCHAVMKARKLGGGWYGVPDLSLRQSYGRLDTHIKQ